MSGLGEQAEMATMGAASAERGLIGVEAKASGLAVSRRVEGLTAAVTLLAVAAGTLREVADPDLWWHLATGRYIVSNGRVPAFDVFSFTATAHRWVTHEWLSDLLLYGGLHLVGLAGLGLLFTLVITAAFALVYLRCRSKPVLAGCAVLLAALAASPTYGVRPQMFSLLFASLFLYILECSAGAGRRVWLLVPLTLIWANLHSGFVAGLAIVAVFALGEELSWVSARRGQGQWLAPRARQLALVFLGCLAASLVTPNGISAVLFPFGTLSDKVIQANIQEWASPNFHETLAWPLAALWLALGIVLAMSRQRLRVTELLLLVGASVATMYSIRHVQFLALVVAPVLAERVHDLWTPQRAGSARALGSTSRLMEKTLWLVAGLLVIVVGVRAQAASRRTAEVERVFYPSSAVSYMRDHGIGGRVFNTYHWGGYLIWQGYQVFVDGRAEVYGDTVLGEYVQARSVSSDWEKPLQRYGVDAALIQTDSQLAVVMGESAHWQAVYRDELATLFVPAPARNPGS